jgi:hypothetical protein
MNPPGATLGDGVARASVPTQGATRSGVGYLGKHGASDLADWCNNFQRLCRVATQPNGMPQLATSQQLLVFVDYVVGLLPAFRNWRPLDAAALETVEKAGADPQGLPGHVQDVLTHLRHAAVLRGLDSIPIHNFSVKWFSLHRDHPSSPNLALAHFGEYFDEQACIELIRCLEPLRIHALHEKPASAGAETWLRHSVAVAQLRLDPALSNQQRSAYMKRYRERAGPDRLRCENRGNEWWYHPEDWAEVVRLARAGRRGRTGSFDEPDDYRPPPPPTPDEIERGKAEAKARRSGR